MDIEMKNESIEQNTGGGSQIYIGTPAGIVLCVDGAGTGDAVDINDMEACLWHGYSQDAVSVRTPEHMLGAMEDLFELINYPRATTSLRSFTENGSGRAQNGHAAQGLRAYQRNPSNVPRHITDDELLQKRGEAATFIIRVQQRQNSNWQGRLTWVEKDKTQRFRTIMEMLKLIEEALEAAGGAK